MPQSPRPGQEAGLPAASAGPCLSPGHSSHVWKTQVLAACSSPHRAGGRGPSPRGAARCLSETPQAPPLLSLRVLVCKVGGEDPRGL